MYAAVPCGVDAAPLPGCAAAHDGVRCTTGSTGSPRVRGGHDHRVHRREVDRPVLVRLRRPPVERRPHGLHARGAPSGPTREPNGLPSSVSGPSACAPSQPRGTLRADAGAATSNATKRRENDDAHLHPRRLAITSLAMRSRRARMRARSSSIDWASAGSASDSRWKRVGVDPHDLHVGHGIQRRRARAAVEERQLSHHRRRLDRLERRLLARDPHGQRAVDQQVQRAVDLAGLHEREPGRTPRAPRRTRRSSPSRPRSRRAGREARPSPREPLR